MVNYIFFFLSLHRRPLRPAASAPRLLRLPARASRPYCSACTAASRAPLLPPDPIARTTAAPRPSIETEKKKKNDRNKPRLMMMVITKLPPVSYLQNCHQSFNPRRLVVLTPNRVVPVALDLCRRALRSSISVHLII